MPEKKRLHAPKYPIVYYDHDGPITERDLRKLLKPTGITLLFRFSTGDPKRGGYYFQIEPTEAEYILRPFDAKSDDDVYRVDFELLLELINHISGRTFSAEAFNYVRNSINMPSD